MGGKTVKSSTKIGLKKYKIKYESLFIWSCKYFSHQQGVSSKSLFFANLVYQTPGNNIAKNKLYRPQITIRSQSDKKKLRNQRFQFLFRIQYLKTKSCLKFGFFFSIFEFLIWFDDLGQSFFRNFNFLSKCYPTFFDL